MKKSFINKIKDGAIEAYIEYNILPSLTIAQAILETGWGKSSIGNNIFGIKASGGWKGKTQVVNTREFINGKWLTVKAEFRDYDSIEESIRDRSKFLTKNRYKSVLTARDYKTAALAIHQAGYATDPNYAKLLIRIIETNRLFEFDREALKIKNKENQKSKEEVKMDKNKPSEWAKEHWEWATKNGLFDGSRPKDNITREEVAIVLRRVVSKRKWK